jgi:beta-lactamase regulating signal transducer with metallopeptidase domain
MNGIEMQWAAPAVQAVAWALVHFLWQGALAGLAAAALLRALRGARASTRYAVTVGLLVLLALLPVATALRLAGAPTAAPRAAEPGAVPSARLAELGRLTPVAAAGEMGEPSLASPLARLLPPALPWIFGAWLLGVLLFGIAHLGGWWQVRRLVRRARPLGGEVEARLGRLRRRLGVERAVRLLESAAVPVPAVIGWLRPAILVPASTMTGLSPWQLDAILAHELAHVRRHDYLVNLFQAAVETLLFYHPAVWWLSNEVRRERECCCDDLAVELCGDRLSYARALADLEGLRLSPSRLAMAADGGSLVDRVRRLVGAPVRRSRRSWLVGLLALALLPAGLALRWARGESAERSWAEFDSDYADSVSKGSATEEKEAARAPSSQAAVRTGTWKAEWEGDKVQLESTMAWKSKGESHRWQNGETYSANDLVGLTRGPEVRFELRRDAGRFLYEGRFRGDRGSGTFTFQADPGYLRDMAALGYKLDDWKALTMALHDVSLAFVREIRSFGYQDSSLDTLVTFRIHKVNPGLIRELAAAGLSSVPADDLVQLQIHQVSPDFIRGLAAAGYRDLRPDSLVQFRIHGDSVEQVRGLEEAGLHGLSPDDLVQLRIHDISADSVHGLIAAGLRETRVDDLVQLKIHGIAPEYLRGLTEAGLKGLSTDQLVQLRIHGVDGSFVRSVAGRYAGKLSPDDLVQLKIRGRLDR